MICSKQIIFMYGALFDLTMFLSVHNFVVYIIVCCFIYQVQTIVANENSHLFEHLKYLMLFKLLITNFGFRRTYLK